uniref:Putative chaperone protein DNAJ n=1 Tax=Trypanosoma vivax (strain Y486) TaxID=1055687 RepID=G0TXL7_TRYVY|nr:putative chaperone protein DNAJ, fragment [Trypanosoma vivax Y486]
MPSGLTARRLILQQVHAVVQHSPFRATLGALSAKGMAGDIFSGACASGGRLWWARLLVHPRRSAFTLMTEDEMTLMQRQREEEGEESRVVLSTRPTRNILKALGGVALNISLSFLVSPFLALSVSLEAVRIQRFGLVTAPVSGLLWGSVLSYERPLSHVGASHPLLHLHGSHEKLVERAMRRELRRNKRRASYERRKGSKGIEDEDYYAVLGVPKNAKPQQIKEAYNRLALKVHPDRNPNQSAATQFDAITKAYRVLSNPEKRRKYDIGGASGIEDIGKRKRDAVRALFGGDTLCALVGDVKTGCFSQRVVDGLDWTQEEIAVFRQRMQERCRDELHNAYLRPLCERMDCDSNKGNERTRVAVGDSSGLNDLRRHVRQVLNTGLAREVVHAVGHEYMRVVQYCEASGPLGRLQLFLFKTWPHRVQRRLEKYRLVFRIRQHTFKDSAAMVDLAWFTSVEELETTARWVATAILLGTGTGTSADRCTVTESNPECNAGHENVAERRKRLEAMRMVAETFIAHGQPYKGANRQTMDALMNSMRDYQQKQRCKEERAD